MIVGTIVVGAMIVGAMSVGAMIVGAMIVETMVVGAMIVGTIRRPQMTGPISIKSCVPRIICFGKMRASVRISFFCLDLNLYPSKCVGFYCVMKTDVNI